MSGEFRDIEKAFRIDQVLAPASSVSLGVDLAPLRKIRNGRQKKKPRAGGFLAHPSLRKPALNLDKLLFFHCALQFAAHTHLLRVE